MIDVGQRLFVLVEHQTIFEIEVTEIEPRNEEVIRIHTKMVNPDADSYAQYEFESSYKRANYSKENPFRFKPIYKTYEEAKNKALEDLDNRILDAQRTLEHLTNKRKAMADSIVLQ